MKSDTVFADIFVHADTIHLILSTYTLTRTWSDCVDEVSLAIQVLNHPYGFSKTGPTYRNNLIGPSFSRSTSSTLFSFSSVRVDLNENDLFSLLFGS